MGETICEKASMIFCEGKTKGNAFTILELIACDIEDVLPNVSYGNEFKYKYA